MAEVVQRLVVEGQDDQHVIWALCKRYDLAETFTVVTPKSGGKAASRQFCG